MKAANRSAAAPQGRWDRMTDEELLQVQWSTTDPMSLPNVEQRIPANLGEFEVELGYDLPPEDAVLCAHCPQHQRHQHGYVIKNAQGRRFLLGSICGPKAYGADYGIASQARDRAEKRYKALVKWHSIREMAVSELDELAAGSTSEPGKSVRRMRAMMERNAPRTLAALRLVRPSGNGGERRLSIVVSRRDTAKEEEIGARWYRAVAALADEPLSNKEHARRLNALRDELGFGKEIIIQEERDLGQLAGADWLLTATCPAKQLSDSILRLRALVAIGAKTDGRPVSDIGQWARAAEKELDAARAALGTIDDAAAFFSPQHLEAVVAWLMGQARPPCHASTDGTALTLYEYGQETFTLTVDGLASAGSPARSNGSASRATLAS